MKKNIGTINDLGKILINLSSIKFNYKILKNKVGKNCDVSAVLKADAYGLGAKKIGKVLENLGCKIFFVANISEAIELRKNLKQCEILVLNGPSIFSLKGLGYFNKYRLIPVLNSLEDLESLIELKKKKSDFFLFSIALHFDTGMNRLGIKLKDLGKVRNLVIKNNLKIFSVMSHLSSSDEPKNLINSRQKLLFGKLVDNFPNTKLSIANSTAIFNLKNFNYSFIRSGGALFGINPFEKKNPLQNVVSLLAKVIQLRNIRDETIKTIGYNSFYRLNKPIKIGVLGVGYADGYPRRLSNVGYGIFKNKKLPIVGNISMDYMTVDLSNLKSEAIKVGDWVELIGENITIQEVANLSETIEYEILNNLGNRLKKKYIDSK